MNLESMIPIGLIAILNIKIRIIRIPIAIPNVNVVNTLTTSTIIKLKLRHMEVAADTAHSKADA